MSTRSRLTRNRYEEHRLLVLGQIGSGKTALLDQLCHPTPDAIPEPAYDPSGAVHRKLLTVDGQLAMVDPTEHQVSENDETLNAAMKEIHGIVFIYSITSEESFLQLQQLMSRLENFDSKDRWSPFSPFLILVGCKSDLESERKVSREQGEQRAWELGADFVEITVKDVEAVEKVFVDAVRVRRLRIANTPPNDVPEKQKVSVQSSKPHYRESGGRLLSTLRRAFSFGSSRPRPRSVLKKRLPSSLAQQQTTNPYLDVDIGEPLDTVEVHERLDDTLRNLR